MDISETIPTLSKWIGGTGALGLLVLGIRYSVTFTNSRLIERRLQRQEFQYLHKTLTFIFFVILAPFFYSYGLTVVFENLTNNDNRTKILKILSFFTTLQILNIIILFVIGSSQKILKDISEIISNHKNWLRYLSIIIAFFTSFTWCIFIINLGINNDVAPNALIIYIVLFLPYYIGLIKNINKDVLVNIYLQNDKELNNLLLAHRSFGKDLVFYEIEDTLRLRPILINKDNIQMILSVEYSINSENSTPEKELKEFGLRVIKPDFHQEESPQRNKERKRK